MLEADRPTPINGDVPLGQEAEGMGRRQRVADALKSLSQFQDSAWSNIFNHGIPFYTISFDLGDTHYSVIPHDSRWLEINTQVIGQDTKTCFQVFGENQLARTIYELDKDGPRETRGAYVITNHQEDTPGVIDEFKGLLSRFEQP